jgi:hypothetical protein
MTSTIKAICPTCGKIDLTPPDVSLRVCTYADLAYYEFSCPGCKNIVRKPADDHDVSKLVSVGVLKEDWDVPAEALETHTGPAFTYDDVLDLHEALKRTEYLALLANQTR